MEVSEMNNNKV